MELHTERLRIVPLTLRQINLLMENIPMLEKDLQVEYCGDSIEGHLLEAVKSQYSLAMGEGEEDFIWYTFWQFILQSENKIIGSACFKGKPDANRTVEIGYGVQIAFENQGYTTEAVKELCAWALRKKGVERVIAETEIGNIASHRVLEKCGMKKYTGSSESIWWEL